MDWWAGKDTFDKECFLKDLHNILKNMVVHLCNIDQAKDQTVVLNIQAHTARMTNHYILNNYHMSWLF